MRGTSGASATSVAAAFEPVLRAAGPEAGTLGAQLYAVVDALEGSGSLRRALSDPSRDAEGKARLVAGLLTGKVDERVVDAVSALARARWTSEADLTEALDELAAEAVLASAQSAGTLEGVEDELFRLDRLLLTQPELRRALTDRSAAPENRTALVHQLLGGKVQPATLQLVERAAASPQGRTMASSLTRLGELAARRRQLLIASVTAAAPLGPDQAARLVSLLSRAYGRAVQLNITIDPAIVGGLRVQVGPEVVDSTVLARLDDARRQLAG